MKLNDKILNEMIKESLNEGKSFHNKKFKSKVEDGYINWEVIGETDKNGRYKVRIHRHYIYKPKKGYQNIRKNTSHFVYLTFSDEKDRNGTPYWNNYTVKSIINNYTNKNKIQTTFDVIKDKYGSQAQATSKGKLSKTSMNLVNRGWGMNVEGGPGSGRPRAATPATDKDNKRPTKNPFSKESPAYEPWEKKHGKKKKNEGKLTEDWNSFQPFSSKEAKSVIDGALKNYAKDLRKVQYRVVKDWMSKAKAGVIDYYDIVRGLKTGDIRRAHPYETEFLFSILNKDKIIQRFNKYFGGKKSMNQRLVNKHKRK